MSGHLATACLGAAQPTSGIHGVTPSAGQVGGDPVRPPPGVEAGRPAPMSKRVKNGVENRGKGNKKRRGKGSKNPGRGPNTHRRVTLSPAAPTPLPAGTPGPQGGHHLGLRERSGRDIASTCPSKKDALHPASGHPRLGGAWN